MSGNPLYTMLLLGMGCGSFSVTPSCDSRRSRRFAARVDDPAMPAGGRAGAGDWKTPATSRTYLREELTKILPEFGRVGQRVEHRIDLDAATHVTSAPDSPRAIADDRQT